MKFSKTTIIVLFLVIGVAIYAFFGTATDRLIWRTTNAFEGLDLPTSFELVNETKKKIHGFILFRAAKVAQVRTYRIPMDMASAQEILLGLMRENEDVLKSSYDIYPSMRPYIRGISALEETCSPGRIALESGTYMTVIYGDTHTYMTVIFGDTEEDVSVELDSYAEVNTYVREVYGAVIYVEKGDYYIVTFADDDVVGKYSTYDEALEVAWETNPNRSYDREFCNTDSDETYVTIVMWAINEW